MIRDFICYPNLLPFETTVENVDAFMRTLAGAGVTHVQVNHLPDLMHPEQLNQPDNVYLWFANFGPPLDLFVDSSLNRGLWPEMYLERNRKMLFRFAEAAKRHGLRPLLYLCEPRFVPERFFQRHPTLRGPRVDNPNCSRVPLYALCTDRPEVLEHYREMMAKMMALVPDLALVSLFTSDSGAGFDYNPATYAGANGSGFNRRIPLENRVNRFLSVLLDEGRKRNPDFTVNLTSGFHPPERSKILAAAPAGVVGSVYGLYDWEGGLEEQWGYHQAVWGEPSAKWTLRTLDRTAAATDRLADIRDRFEEAARKGGKPIVHAELPTTDYPRPLRYTPHPFETIRIVRQIQGLGAERVAMWGVISPPDLVPHDVNLEAMKAANADPDADPQALIEAVARRWVGETHAQALVEAWRLCDQAWTRRPLWTHVGLSKQALPGPLVPDPAALTPDEVAYYRTVALDDLDMIRGSTAFAPHEADEEDRQFVLHELYEKETLPGLRRAVQVLDAACDGATDGDLTVLRRQREHIHYAYLYMRSHYNWYEAGRHLAPGAHASGGTGRSMREIVDDELQVTREVIELLDGRQEQFMRTMPSDSMTYEFGPGFVEHLKARVTVMEKHRDDPVRPVA